jgi:hypothetical protein
MYDNKHESYGEYSRPENANTKFEDKKCNEHDHLCLEKRMLPDDDRFIRINYRHTLGITIGTLKQLADMITMALNIDIVDQSSRNKKQTS